MDYRCQACGFRVFNRRYPRCESCGVALAAGIALSAEELAQRQATDREEEARAARRRRATRDDLQGRSGAGWDVPWGLSDATDGGGDGGADGGFTG